MGRDWPVRAAILRLLDLVLPVQCQACRSLIPSAPGRPRWFCDPCWTAIPLFTGPACSRCGRPFESGPDHPCAACEARPPAFDRAVAAGPYDGVLAQAICLFKYQQKTALARRLGGLLVTRLADLARPDVVIPVPLHPRRLRLREFNQSLLLAQEVGRAADLPLDYQAVVRVGWAPPQVEVSGADRLTNVRGAFAVRDPSAVAERSVLLVDDVFTTGATVNECAKVVRQAGAVRVDVLTVARTV